LKGWKNWGMENIGRLEKWEEKKDFCFSFVFCKSNGKAEG